MTRLCLKCAAIVLPALALPVHTPMAATTETYGQSAPEASAQLDEVIVTARRKQENLQSVPLTVTAVDAESLRAHSVLQVEDLPRVVPGLSTTPSPYGASSPNYIIRGQRGALLPTSLTDPAVAVYFGEVNQSHNAGTNQSLYDLQSVQVVKGPQGTLFGRNSTGGAVLIVPNSPADSFEGYLQAGAGDFDFQDYEGMVNVPLGETLAMRVTGKLTQRDGYLSNVLTGQKVYDVDADSYRLSLAWQPNDHIRSTFIGAYFEGEGAGWTGKFAFLAPAAVPAVATMAERLQTALTEVQALGDYDFEAPQSNRVNALDRARSIQNTTEIDLGELPILGAATLKNVVGYRDVANRHTDDFIGADIDVFFSTGTKETEQYSEELQLQGKTRNLDYIAGLYYFEEEITDAVVSRQFGFLNALAPASFPRFSTYDVDGKSKSYAAFVHGTYALASLLDGLSVSAGVRLTRDERSIVYHNIGISPGSGPQTFTCTYAPATPLPSNDRNLCAVDGGDLSSTEPTYDVSVNYQVNPRALVYVAHRKGYRSGSFNQVPSPVDFVSTKAYDPEFVTDVELGSKTDFHLGSMPARLNVAAYYQWYKDAQKTNAVVLPGGANASVIVNAAKAHIYGGDVEFLVQPLDLLEVSGSYALTRPAYDSWDNVYRDGAGVNTVVDVSSSPFSFVPEHQFSVSARLNVPVPQSYGRPAVMITYYGQSRTFTADTGPATCEPQGGSNRDCLSREFVVPSYRLWNLRADWRDAAGLGIDLSLFVNNLADKFYYNGAVSAVGNLGTGTAGIAPPRMWGMSLRIPFGDVAR